MPANRSATLNVVAAEYLRNIDELEAARDLFQGERAKLLDNFGALMVEAAGKQKQDVASTQRDDEYGLFDVDVNGAYVAVRAKAGRKRSSGYSAGLGSFLEHVGGQALLWFHLKLNPTKQKKLELATLEKQLGSGARLVVEGSWFYIRTAEQPASDLDLDALRDELRRLPELFAIADKWIAKRWED